MRSRKKANVVVGAELGVSGGRAVLDDLPGVSSFQYGDYYK